MEDSNRTIEHFVNLLSKVSRQDYIKTFENFDFKSIDFECYESWCHDQYTRNCIYKNQEFELLLICWDRHQETSVHNHDGEDCWVHVLKGEIEEIFYNFDEKGHLRKIKSHIASEASTSFINDKIALHKLKNNFDGKTMSLHLYAKPIEKCRSYCEDSGHFEERVLEYDSQNGVNEN